jgi:hypothetical protein
MVSGKNETPFNPNRKARQDVREERSARDIALSLLMLRRHGWKRLSAPRDRAFAVSAKYAFFFDPLRVVHAEIL